MNLQDGVSLLEGLIITLFSMGIVFVTLIVISFILWIFKLIFYKETSLLIKKDEKNEELIAVITAAITAHNNNNIVAAIAGAITTYNKNENRKLRVKRIKKIS
jgi:Na+-transporting methylmalonyl-CoA/oxaloacetate decarboxylase gamma subunit